jgi:hypothetical protein
MQQSLFPSLPSKLFTFGDYDQILFAGKPFITGRPNFWPENFGALKPGMKVCQIGAPGRNGKVTSSARIDTWTPYVEYMGTISIQDFSKTGPKSALHSNCHQVGGPIPPDDRDERFNFMDIWPASARP